MVSSKPHKAKRFALLLVMACLTSATTFAAANKSQITVRELHSEAIAHNKIGIDSQRQLLVYLPAGYDDSSYQRYPVIYFLPNPFEDGYRYDFDLETPKISSIAPSPKA